jgi:sulfate-transporting ATPase
MGYQYIYVMKDLTKSFPGGKEVLKNVYLSYYPGAKIGVLGPNGSGKSTLLKIMAGIDKEFNGEAWAMDGTKIGYLEQEPKLNPKKNVMENIMEALGEKTALLEKFNDVSNKLGEVTDEDEMNKLLEEQASLLGYRPKIEIAMDALRCPPGDADVKTLSGGEIRRVASARCCCPSPTFCCSTNRPTTSTPNRWPG